MKNFSVTKIKWANYSDLELPFYRSWNRNNKLPLGFWQRIWEYPFVILNIPKEEKSLDVGGTYPFVLFKHFPKAISLDIRDLNQLDHPLHKGLWPKEKLVIGDALAMPFNDNEFRYSFSISAIEEMPEPLKAVQEMLRVTSERVVITFDVSNKLGVNEEKLRALLDFLGVELPPVPADVLNSADKRQRRYRQKPLTEFAEIKVLGLVIDKNEIPKDCAILIPHSESFDFLKICVNEIKKNTHPNVRHHIYIIDDNSQDGSFEKIEKLYQGDSEITLEQVKRGNFKIPDVGQVIDWGLKLVKEQFVCMIDADVFPMSRHWLNFSIWLLEKYNCSSVGTDTGLSTAYFDSFPGEWQNKNGYLPDFGIFSNSNFTCTNNFYRLVRTAEAKVISELTGYRRYYSQLDQWLDLTLNAVLRKINNYWRRKIFPELFVSQPVGDNGVRANWFIDANRLGPKFSLPILNWLGKTPNDGVFGQNICGLIMHFALSSRVLSRSHKEVRDPGKDYLEFVQNLLKDNTVLERYFEEVGFDHHQQISQSPHYQWLLAQQEKLNQVFADYLTQNHNA